VERLEQALSTGWAVKGAADTLRALARGQIRVLLVSDGAGGAGFRCRDTGQLVATKTECRGAGRPLPIANLVDHAIEDAIRQRAEVVVLDDPKLAAKLDTLAATLRFRV